MNKKIKTSLFVVIAVLAALIIVSGVVWGITKTKKPAFLYNAIIAEKTPVYSLVYVQVGSNPFSYYGQIIKNSEEAIVLKDPGYIDVQQSTEEGEQAQVSFRLMESDFLKPLPEMMIYKQNIIFIQDLSADSPIVSAYEDAK
ncbi:MAG: hypothetical protein WC523_07265 [Patescibacteria group bacterium]